MPRKPRIFIGSSSGERAIKIIAEIKRQLQEVALVQRWDGDVFELSQATIESLEKASINSDFGILVLTADDLRRKKGAWGLVPRDNVVFEIGLFMGRLGRLRTFVVCDQKVEDLQLPSDLFGFNNVELKQRGAQSLSDALRKPCKKIRGTIESRFRVRNDKRELGALYRMVNACTYPDYPDVQVRELDNVAHRRDETFETADLVIEFLLDQFSDFIYPALSTEELTKLRVYFAYYLGDGADLLNPKGRPTACRDWDAFGKPFFGTFVIGHSNPKGFIEESWRVGRVIPGFESDTPMSNCATAFGGRRARYRNDLSEQASSSSGPNYRTDDENSIYTVPVLWYTREGSASVGVLAVSSKETEIAPEVRIRVDFLSNVIGYLFALHADRHLPRANAEPAVDAIGSPLLGIVPKPGQEASRFSYRAMALRRSIATYFERQMVQNKIHVWNGKVLTVVPSTMASGRIQPRKRMAVG